MTENSVKRKIYHSLEFKKCAATAAPYSEEGLRQKEREREGETERERERETESEILRERKRVEEEGRERWTK